MLDVECYAETQMCVGRAHLRQPLKAPRTLSELRAYIATLSGLLDELESAGVDGDDWVQVYGSLSHIEQVSAQWETA